MFYRCPHCNELFATDALPLARCPLCGVVLRLVPSEIRREDIAKLEADIAEARRSVIPWETTTGSIASRFWRTLGQLLQSPPRFFLQIAEGNGRRAEIFAYVVSLLGLACFFGLQALVFADDHGELGDALMELGDGAGGVPSSLVIARVFRFGLYLSPVLALFPAHIAAGLYQLGLFMVGAGGRSYEVTFRVAAYGLAPLLVLGLPGIGIVLAPGWVLALHWVGLAIAHRLPLLTAAIAMSIPLLLFIFLSSPVLAPAILYGLQLVPAPSP